MANRSVQAAGQLFPAVASTPAVQSLRQRLESGSALSCSEVSVSAQPFFGVLLRSLFPKRPIVVVTSGLKVQETFHQDIQTWLEESAKCDNLFYPAWEIFPHEPKLPHVDVI